MPCALQGICTGLAKGLFQDHTWEPESQMDEFGKMEHRRHERFESTKDATVALLFQPEKCEHNLVGPLINISQSGLAFSFLPLDKIKTPARGHCTISLIGSGLSAHTIRCRKVYEVAVPRRSFFLPPPKRVGVEFLLPLSGTEFKSIISALSCIPEKIAKSK